MEGKWLSGYFRLSHYFTVIYDVKVYRKLSKLQLLRHQVPQSAFPEKNSIPSRWWQQGYISWRRVDTRKPYKKYNIFLQILSVGYFLWCFGAWYLSGSTCAEAVELLWLVVLLERHVSFPSPALSPSLFGVSVFLLGRYYFEAKLNGWW